MYQLFGKKDTRDPLRDLLDRPRPSSWQRFLNQPYIYIAQKLYTSSWLPVIAPAQTPSNPVSVVCVSDTHNSQPVLPDGDILIHAGDLTQSGSAAELQASVDWLRAQRHKIKIVVAGNHDLFLDAEYPRHKHDDHNHDHYDLRRRARRMLDWGDIIYLQDTETTITCPNGRRLKVYGSPLTPKNGNWAFQYQRSMSDVWAGKVPDNTDILITHGPPRGHLDLSFGCVYLLRELWRVKPRLHVFGHVHDAAGTERLQFNALQDRYERVVVSGGGVWNLICLVWQVLMVVLFRRPGESRCLLVNSAIAHGLWDDKSRPPVRVMI